MDEGIDDVHEGCINHAVWSDNIWLIGKNEKDVSMMVKSLTNFMNQYALKWKDGNTKMMCSGGYNITEEMPLQVTITDKIIEISWKNKTNILGSLVDDTGGTNVMLQASTTHHFRVAILPLEAIIVHQVCKTSHHH